MAMKTQFHALPQTKIQERGIYKPEFTISTEEKYTINLGEETRALKFNPRVHVARIKQWINKTQPKKEPFDDKSEVNLLSGPHIPGNQSTSTFTSTSESDLLEEKWKQREFNRLYADAALNYELLSVNAKTDVRKINEKLDKYKKAFLKGFYEARIRRIETNRWLYEKLHVNPEHVKAKYRQLMFASQAQYLPENLEKNEHPILEDEKKKTEIDENEEVNSATIDTQKAYLETETASVYSFVPERDNILLQDVNAPPQVRGFGQDKHSKYDSNVRLLHLDDWVSPDIQLWLNEKKLKEHDSEEEQSSAIDDVISDKHLKLKQKEDEYKYEQIPRVGQLPIWLGPKLLNGEEIDLENFHKISNLNEKENTNVGNEQRKQASVVEEKIEEESGVASQTPSKYLLRRLIQSQSQEYYRLWYGAHDMYNTTPFMEARLQRLMREIFTKKEWSVYCSYLKNKQEKKTMKLNTVDNSPQL